MVPNNLGMKLIELHNVLRCPLKVRMEQSLKYSTLDMVGKS